MTDRTALPFHPIALFLGAFGTLLLALGILGAIGALADRLPILSEPMVWGVLTFLGAATVVAEIVIVVVGIRNRRQP